MPYLRPLISWYLYTTINRQKKKDFGEIEKIEKIQSKNVYIRITYNPCVCVCVCRLYLRIAVCSYI